MIGINLSLELDRTVDAAISTLKDSIESGVDRGGDRVADNARVTTAFRDRSGDLRGDIEAADVVRDDDGASVRIVADAGHAKFLEGGTKIADAHPFLGPALDDEFEEAVGDVVEAVERGLERAGW